MKKPFYQHLDEVTSRIIEEEKSEREKRQSLHVLDTIELCKEARDTLQTGITKPIRRYSLYYWNSIIEKIKANIEDFPMEDKDE